MSATALCCSCGNPIELEGSVRVLEFPDYAIRDLRRIDEDLADEIESKGGHLALHKVCRHPVEQYLPGGTS